MRNIFALTLIGSVVSGCGGGGTSLTAGIDQDFSADHKTATDVLKQYSNGDAVIAFKGVLQDGSPSETPRYYFVLSQDAQAAIDTFNGVVVWENINQYYDQGNVYGIIREGANAKGESIYVNTVGRNLNLSGSEFVSYSFVRVEEDAGYLTSGTTITSLPSGNFLYTGSAIIGIEAVIESGDNFSLSADFNNKELSFTALTENFYASANELRIDTSNGSFSGDGGTIGERNSTFSMPATVVGAFAGTNAGGVHGVVYPTLDNENDGFTAFIAER